MQIVFQDPYASLNPRMTIGQILTFPMNVQGLYAGRREERIMNLLERVGMRASDMNRYPHEFSGRAIAADRHREGVDRRSGVHRRG